MSIGNELEQLVQQLFVWAEENGNEDHEICLSEDKRSATYELGLLVSNADEAYDGFLDLQIDPSLLNVYFYTDITVSDENEAPARALIEKLNEEDDLGFLQLIGDDRRLRLSITTELRAEESLGALIDDLLPLALDRLDDQAPQVQGLAN